MADLWPSPAASRIDLAEEPEFCLGGIKVRPAGRVVVKNGEQRELQPRVMQVLVALAKARPGVVSRDRIAELCWDGRLVGDDALNRCILALRHLAQEFSPPPFAIETVPRIGHRLVERGAAARGPGGSGRMRLVLVLFVVLAVLAAGFFAWQQRSGEPGAASIAVLPFRNLSSGDSHFAEGVGEEILVQLAREPQFRVAGGSSSRLLPRNADMREVAERLGVDYVVEGSVRRQGDRIRVNAHLLKARDGIRLWSDSYDGNLDDIFAIQRRIGVAIAGALQRKLVRTPALSGPLVTDGKAYSLYLTARGLIRTRARRAGPTAVDLLRDAIQIDPGYAPAWASLGEATLLAGALKDRESFVASASQAQGHARHALELSPDLAEAHRTLGGLVGFGTPKAVAHLHRAAELDPNSAENMIGLGIAHGASGEFEKELAAYRRALELDPLWFRAVSSQAVAATEMGDRAGAEAIARRALPANGIEQNLVLAKAASMSGDFSEAVRRWSMVVNARSPRWSETARRSRNEVAFAVGIRTGPIVTIPRPLDQRHLGRVWMDRPPTPSVWKLRNRNALAAAVYRDDNHVAAKLMLNEGRSGELAAAYDGPGGMVGIRRGERLRIDQLSEAAVVALALRRAGRNAEAERLLREAEGLVERVYGRGRVPFWFDADAAALSAVRGRKSEAISRLERAVDRGWRHAGSTDLRELVDEPSFRSLGGDARFERLRRRLSAHHAREREETRRVLGTQ